MVNRLIMFAALLFEILPVCGQDLTRAEADSLRLILTRPKSDTEQLDTYFRLAEFYIDKPGANKQDQDSAVEYLKMTEVINERLKSEDTGGIQALINALIAKERKQEKQSKEMLEEAVRMLSSSKKKYYLGRAYFHLSDHYRYTDRTQIGEKIRLVELAVQCYAQSKYIETYANSLKYLADLYEINEQRTKVLENLDLSLKMYQSIHYPELAGVYVLYNRYYYLRGNYKLALDYCLLALKNAEQLGDSTLLYCQINNYMAVTLVHLNERERATDYFKTALHISEKYKSNADVLYVMNNMVHNYIVLKKPQEALQLMKSIPAELLVPTSDEAYILTSLCYASIYFELKKYAETGVYCDQILELMKAHMPSAQVVNDFYHLLIEYYLASRQYALAGYYLPKIDSMSRKLDDPARIKENYYLAFRLDTATGATRSAIANLLKFQHLHDSLFDETSQRQMQQMEVQYETQKNRNEIKIKDQDIVLLNQENQLQQSGLERAVLIRNFTMAGIVLLSIIVVLLYKQYRDKQRSSKVISGKNEILQSLVVEKEWLLKEIHHRVKNNFQTVMGLLGTQTSYLKNEAAINAISDSQRRIQSMSLIHQKLYQSSNLSSIKVSDYIHELVDFLTDSFNSNGHVDFRLDLDPVECNLTYCIPLALILNEAITNSFKYAFPNNAEGTIFISFKEIVPHQFLLIIKDNGPGLPAGFNINKSDSMGMNLMRGLSAEIKGKFSICGENGTMISVSFIYNQDLISASTTLKTE